MSSKDCDDELLPEPSSDGGADAADGDAVAAVAADSDSEDSDEEEADGLAEPSGSDTAASHKDASSDVALSEELALGKELAATLEHVDIAAVVPDESHRR